MCNWESIKIYTKDSNLILGKKCVKLGSLIVPRIRVMYNAIPSGLKLIDTINVVVLTYITSK
jgi:hypothetical protein